MCGILCEICYGKETVVLQDKIILQRLRNRGPDYVQTVKLDENGVCAGFVGAVLWMQGLELSPQPVSTETGIVLHNGDIFDYSWDCKVSDTETITKEIIDIEKEEYSKQEGLIISFIRSLKGPFSFIYFNRPNGILYFSRDKLGRNSLLCHSNECSIVLSSVLGRNYKCIELPASKIYALNLKNRKIKLFTWASDDVEECAFSYWYESIMKQQSLADDQFQIEIDLNKNLDYEDPLIDFIKGVALENKCKRTLFSKLLTNETISRTVAKLIELLKRSMEIRMKTQPNRCKDCITNDSLHCCHCTVGILFSGGLDCTILAFLADKYVKKDQPIDLINVAFKKDECSSYDVPDRITGRQSFNELKKLCRNREWVFKEINVPKYELDEQQSTKIADLVYPRKTILDESLGSALWFAAKGNDETDTSPCRMLVLGSGADELFGGYSRHKNAYKYHGWPGLNEELLLDWKRISFRNLARDNRVICDHGRQPRLPYLDEDFTQYVTSLKPWLRCFPDETLGPGIGDKLMLRLVAIKFGLDDVAGFPKRALQFGSRIANKKEKGSDISKNMML